MNKFIMLGIFACVLNLPKGYVNSSSVADCACMIGNVPVCTKNVKLRNILCQPPNSSNYSVDASTSQLKWVDLNMGHIPHDAVLGGYQELYSLNDYIILTPYQEGIHVGKITVRFDGTGAIAGRFCHDGEEKFATSFLILTAPRGSYSWDVSRKGHGLPRGALRAGEDPASGKAYHVGRGAVASSVLVPGQIAETTIYIPYYGVNNASVFEVLIDHSQV